MTLYRNPSDKGRLASTAPPGADPADIVCDDSAPADITPEEDEHLRKLLAQVAAGKLTMKEAALILQAAHPDLPARVRDITGNP